MRRPNQNVLPLEWFDGEFYPPQEIRDLFKGKEYPAESAMLIGTDGAMLIPHQELPVLLPEDKFVNYKRPEFEAGNHYHAFVVACLGGPKTESHFAQTGPMTEAILLGTVANRVPDQLLEWDSVNMKFPNYPRLKNTFAGLIVRIGISQNSKGTVPAFQYLLSLCMNTTTNIDARSIFIFVGIFQGIVLSLFFLIKPSSNTAANRYQGLLLLALSLCILEQTLNLTGYIVKVLYITNTTEPLNLTIGPFLYLFIKRSIDQSDSKKEWIHFILFGLYLGYMIQDYVQTTEFKYNSYINSYHPDWPLLQSQGNHPR